MPDLRVLDLFAGIGGFSLGLDRAGGFETVAFCEQCPKARRVLAKHWPDVPAYDDIRELTYARLQEDGTVPDVITGGFPCQDISNAGKGRGIIGERSGLWSEMFRLIRDVRPTWAIIENVSALRSKGLTLVLQDICSIGYCAEWHCIPASAVGAPHQRDRIWIVAHTVCKHQAERRQRSVTESKGGGRGTDTRGRHVDAEREGSLRCSGGGAAEDVADARCEPTQVQTQRRLPTITQLERSSWWEIEPSVGRVVDGFPGRMDRLKQLGNAVVPQVVEVLGRAIWKADKVSRSRSLPVR